MATGIKKFNKYRLRQIREARGITSRALAEMLGVGPSTVSQYESGVQFPMQDSVDTLSLILNVPTSYFVSEYPNYTIDKIYYRSMSSATKTARTRVERKYELMLEITDYLLNYLDFPALNLPDLDMPSDFREIDSLMIESAAEQVRQHWFLGNSPISNIVKTLESNGIVVWRTATEADTLDAFSEYRPTHPMVILSSDKCNYFRSRFDACHELGHLILHRNIKENVLRNSKSYKIIENQAHHFASSFLLPSKEFTNDLWDVSLDAFRSLKQKWNTSIATMIMRTKELKLIDDDQTRRLWINLSRRGWRKSEPLDNKIIPEEPDLIKNSINLILNEQIKSKDQILMDLKLSASDIEMFVGFSSNFFSNNPTRPSLKLVKK